MRRDSLRFLAVATALVVAGCERSPPPASTTEQVRSMSTCPANESALTLPAGFCASIFAEGLGHARHMVVSPSGALYVNTWSGDYYGKDPLPPGGFLVALKDSRATGKADSIVRFGETAETGGKGGTGIGLYNGYLYAEINDRIVRYKMTDNELIPSSPPEVIVSGLPTDGEHPMHPFAIDSAGMIYIDVGSSTNSCQVKNREKGSAGHLPCEELKTRGGIWRYDANKLGQTFSAADRYVAGIRNAGAIAIDPAGQVYATQHGRDLLSENWPEYFTSEQGATQPAEEMHRIEQGATYGWPQCYYDAAQSKLVLAPEYGGDGGRAVGNCVNLRAPVAAFPAHWAPTAIVFSQSSHFPERYRQGVFIAFHGSWNRAPFEQGGYNVVFQPMKDGKAASGCEIFADGFAGGIKSPDGARHRPTGLAYGSDGSIYISDDLKGRIYRVTFQGDPNKAPASVGIACPSASEPPTRGETLTQDTTNLPVPTGFTKEIVALGNRLYHAERGASTTCVGCHGAQVSGTPLGPDLTDREWLWSDGSVNGIAKSISQGVSQPKSYRNPMPAMGGTQLTPEQVSAIAAYIWAVNHRGDGG